MTETKFHKGDSTSAGQWLVPVRDEKGEMEAERLVGLARKELARAEHGIEDARKARNERCARATILRELIDEIEAP